MFSSKTEFSLYIERTKKESGASYLETLLDYANETGAYDEDIAKMLTETLKQKILVESQEDYVFGKRTDGELEF